MIATYEEFFRRATAETSAPDGSTPFPYQRRLAESTWPDFLEIPTGLGKTAAVVLAWLWKRGWRAGLRLDPDPATPRRLVYCLPMRVLVEQTHMSVISWLRNLGCLGEAGQRKVSVHVLVGGSEDTRDPWWTEHPDEDMVLIGTQDMLLSRALMRGYGMSRFQWPVHFALLHNDALWVYDEVQLMGAGLTTSAQLEAFHRTSALGAASRSLWMSATLNQDWLATVDLRSHLNGMGRFELTTMERSEAVIRARREAVKRLVRARTRLFADDAKGRTSYATSLAKEIQSRHESGANTLVIVNTVARAQAVLQEVAKLAPDLPALLVHARFRPAERRQLNAALRESPAETGRVIVATQAIEAGVDITSRILFTELAPWPSLVQRFGRCNRYGEYNGRGGTDVLWIDIEPDVELVHPYDGPTLSDSRDRLAGLRSASPADLPPVEDAAPIHPVLRRKDLLDLFNIDPDLTGYDVDISGYIRDAEDVDVQVFWRDLSRGVESQPQPGREELCRASLSQLRRYLDRVRRSAGVAWRWDSLDGKWARFEGPARPGLVLMLDNAAGGYQPRLGFLPESSSPVPVAPSGQCDVEERYSADWRSRQPRPIELSAHLGHVEDEAVALSSALSLPEDDKNALARAGRWHDVGKAHPVFRTSMTACDLMKGADALLWAKSPCRGRHARPHFRHELASMLAWVQCRSNEPAADLIAYLIAAHHGKVRTSLRTLPDEAEPPERGRRFARGVWEGDLLPGFAIEGRDAVPETALRLDLIELGESEIGPSWAARVARLLEEHGPFRLAWLETLVRIADWRASRREQGNDDHPRT